MQEKIKMYFETAAKNTFADIKRQYPQFSANIVLREDKLEDLKTKFIKNVKKMKSEMQQNDTEPVPDRHKLSSCAVKAIIDVRIFEFVRTDISEGMIPASIAFANEYFAYVFVLVIVDAFRVKAAKSNNIPVYMFPVIYGSNSRIKGEADVENYYFFDHVFCKLLNLYKKSPSTFPLFDFAILLCSLNTAWNCCVSKEARELYYEYAGG